MSWPGHERAAAGRRSPLRHDQAMADALLDPALNRAGGSQPDDRADSGYAVSPLPAGRDDRPSAPGPGLARQRHDRSTSPAARPARPGQRRAARPGGPARYWSPARPQRARLLEIPDPSRGKWGRVRWLFAAIWLVYLAQPVSKLWSDANLAHRYLGLADLIAFSAVFIVTFAAARFLRSQPNRRLCRQAQRGGGGGRGHLRVLRLHRPRPVRQQPVHLRGRDGGVPAAHARGLGPWWPLVSRRQ